MSPFAVKNSAVSPEFSNVIIAFPSSYLRVAMPFFDSSNSSIFASDGLGVILTSVTSPTLNLSFPQSTDIEFNYGVEPNHINTIRDVANTTKHIMVFLTL